MAPFLMGPWRVDPRKNVLEKTGHRVRVEPKAMRVLVFLAERAGEVVARDDILCAIWEGTPIKAEVLTNAIWELRKALDDDSREPDFIQTVSRKGYRLVAPVDWSLTRAKRRPDGPARVWRWLGALTRGCRLSRRAAVLEGQRRALLRILASRFGPLPAAVVERIQSLEDFETIDGLLDRAVQARSLDEAGLDSVYTDRASS